ncbi:tetratricopeptide repeat protein [Crocinitomix catalasitica]|uniref:tetratricopeptide repeat protein n=1 Tax=Crocinitomix catalasitica TaxID=184607 RepID=UPI000481C5E6|nr:tetratricopeptide repeat protein [Crocinitomix catalasitica]
MKIFWAFSLLSLFLFSCNNSPAEITEELTDTEKSDTILVADSLGLLNQVIVDNPDNASAYFARAKYHMRNLNPQSALIDVEKVLSIDSSILDARILYANIQVSELNIKDAQYQYKYVFAQDSLSTKSLLGLARINSLLDNSAQAIFYIDKALSIDQYLAEAYFLKGMVYRADTYKTKRKESWDRAISSYQTAIEQDPDFYAAYIELGVMYDERDMTLALDYFNSALDIEPRSIEALYNKGMYFQKRNDFDNALRNYRKISRIDSTWADPYYNQGYIYLVKLQNLDSAINYLSLAINYDGNYYQAHNNLGLAYELAGEIDSARLHYKEALNIKPDFQLAEDNLKLLKK